MPFIGKAIVVDSVRRAESQPAVCAADEHHIGCASTGWFHASYDVNVVVRRTPGVVNCEEHHSTKADSVDPALNKAAAETNSGVSVKSRCLSSELRVAGADTAKCCAPAPSTNKNVAIGIYVEAPVYRRIRNRDRALPGNTAICRALECRVGASAVGRIVCLILKSVPRSVRFVDRQPLLVAAARALFAR